MKNVKLSSIGAAAALSALLAFAGLTGAYAQVSMTTSTTSAGTVSEFTPGMITVTSGATALPVSYTYSKTTTYVDENGNPVSSETVRSGVPVTVYYTQDGGQMIASKVVVRHIAEVPTDSAIIVKKTTTTTTTTTPAP